MLKPTDKAQGRRRPALQRHGVRTGFDSILRALRPVQWVKNLLIFVPLAARHAWLDLPGWASMGLLFLVFCGLASSGYLLNDVLDVMDDRRHPARKHRPVAMGSLPPSRALRISGLLALVAFTGCLALPSSVVALVALYFLTSILYSGLLKRLPLLDIACLVWFHMVRVMAGASATEIRLSVWLWAFCGGVFLTAALYKRAAEVRIRVAIGEEARRRFYFADHHRWLKRSGQIAGYASALVLFAYAWSAPARELYKVPAIFMGFAVLCALCNAVIWRKELDARSSDSPLRLLLTNPIVVSVIALGALVFLLVAK